MIPPEEKQKIREEITRRLGLVKASLAGLQEQSKPVAPDNAIGRITRMDAIQQKSVSERNLRTAEEVAMKLEEALNKLDQPDFGICARCRQQIPLERILVMPESRHCVQCASQR